MTIKTVLDYIDAYKASVFPDSQKIKWLSDLDMRVDRDVIQTHQLPDDYTAFTGYAADVDTEDAVLLVTEPYDGIYIRWLEMQIDYANGDYDRYNNTAAAFSALYGDFERYYNRTHMPVGTHIKFF